MKQILLILGVFTCLAAVEVGFGQQNEGVITYEIKINLHRNIPEDRQQMKSVIPEFRTYAAQLFFNGNESLFKLIETQDADPQNQDDTRMRFRNPRNEIYTNYGQLKRIMLKEFMGKKYLIEDTLHMLPWKLLAETKEVNGYICRKATLFDKEHERNIVAWYAEGLRPFLGPDEFNTLPGAVIFVDINDGERTMTAKNIVLRILEENEMVIPDGRNKVTGDAYRNIVKQQTERMRANGSRMRFRN